LCLSLELIRLQISLKMAKIKDIIGHLESIAPKYYQESYDNAGLITGEMATECTGALVTLDCLESVVDEAIEKKCNLIVAHHPIVFKGLTQLNGKNYVERTIIKAIKNDIAIYAIHTNLDNVDQGVNRKIGEIIGLKDLHVLAPKKHTQQKLVTFVPFDHTQNVLNALHASGAGNIGNYSNCSFRVTGTGTFKPNESAIPTSGKVNQLEQVKEDRLELIYPAHLHSEIIQSLKNAHPYEEVAFYIQPLENVNNEIGAGMVGELEEALTPIDFLNLLKREMNLKLIRHTKLIDRKIKKVAICGGAGSFLLKNAIGANADAFVTSDFKYHEFFDAEEKLMISDIGHYESEIFTKDLLHSFLTEKFPNIATYLSEVDTNPVQYY